VKAVPSAASSPCAMSANASRGPQRPSYETVRAVIYRLQAKKIVRRVRRVGNTQFFEAVASREAVRDSLIDDFADMFAGEMQAVFSRLVQTGRLTPDDMDAVERPALG
jgi:BlaI family penicillinase repressor